jgi:hypothetical protein
MTAGKGPPSSVVNQKGHGMNAVARLLLAICAGMAAGGPNVSESGEPPSQAPAIAPSQPVAQSPPVAPAPDTGAPRGSTSTSPVAANPVANKPGRMVLVDDTVNDSQLKQILAKGYRPESQARGNEVYYCRSDHELGSRFESKVCKTARRILQDELQGKEATTTLEQTTGDHAGK